MKLTPTTAPPTAIDWTETFEELAAKPGQWMIVHDHGMAEKSVRPWSYKVNRGKYATANKVAEAHDGTFESTVHENELYLRFVKN